MQEHLLSAQQTDLNATLSGTKWHQERLLQTTIKSNQFTNMPNNRYLTVSTPASGCRSSLNSSGKNTLQNSSSGSSTSPRRTRR